MSLNQRMSSRHEDDLVEVLGGQVAPGSGNQWHRPMDGRHSRFAVNIAFAWDGKSTLGKSVSVSREMWRKAVDQAGGERPMLALRWYDSERLDVGLDLVAISLDDFSELLEASQKAQATLDRINQLLDESSEDESKQELVERLRAVARGHDDPLGVV